MRMNKPGKRIVGITLALMMAVTPFFSTHAMEVNSPPGTTEPTTQEITNERNETNETDGSVSSDTQKEEQTEKEKTDDSVKDKDQGSEDKDAEDSKASDKNSKTTYTSKINGVEITAKLSSAEAIPDDDFYVSNLMTDFSNPVEVVDPTNLKIVTNKDGICLFISRAPIPFPKGEMNYAYQKFVGVGAFTKAALEYYHNTPRGPVEKIEENDSFRFIENRKDCYYINAHCKTLSVDTPKDRVQVERYMKENHLDK